VMPNAPVIDLLVNPTGAIAASGTRDLEVVAPKFGRQLRVHMATNEAEIEAAFAAMAQLHARALVVMADSYFTTRNGQISGLSLRHGIATIFNRREFAAAGGLMSYDSSLAEAYRIFGGYTGRILKGEKPADLPVMQPTRFELVVNLKTAKAIGLTIPEAFLLRADEVIE
jgi:putative tryptophan/tyrosine transport system substrate-binding protein